ncbi:MAG: T9SS type A sorting domain-containing protein [Chitinophagales bacterium]|nr:T9SS type A sorting domain-containing protein [Chitinophagales bacterium]
MKLYLTIIKVFFLLALTLNLFGQDQQITSERINRKPPPNCTVPIMTVGGTNVQCCTDLWYCFPNSTFGHVNWDFGDGRTGTSDVDETFQHCYCPGTYTVTATYTDINNNTHTSTATHTPLYDAEDCEDQAYTFEREYEIIDYSGCSSPSSCVNCDEVVYQITDNSTPLYNFPISSIAWEAYIFNQNIYQYTLYASGSAPIFTFPDWHSAINIVVKQTITDCVGSYEDVFVLKITCFNDGEESFNESIIEQVSQHKSISIRPYFKNNQTIHFDASSFVEDISYNYTLYDLNGKLIANGIIQDNHIDINSNGVSKGIYILHIFDENKHSVSIDKVLML